MAWLRPSGCICFLHPAVRLTLLAAGVTNLATGFSKSSRALRLRSGRGDLFVSLSSRALAKRSPLEGRLLRPCGPRNDEGLRASQRLHALYTRSRSKISISRDLTLPKTSNNTH